MALTEKVSLQAKIAELESRIAALEKKLSFSMQTVNLEENKDWSSMWNHFDRLFAKIFKR